MTSKRRAYLRSLANNIDAIFQVGKNGISDNFINQINDALEARELIKISVLETAPEEILEIANILANSTRSKIVQTMGSKITLYRAREKNSKIILPKK